MDQYFDLADDALDSDDLEIDLSRRKFLITVGSLSCAAALGLLPDESLAAAGRATALERKVESYIKRLRRQGVLSRRDATAWSVYDFTSGKKLVSINENTPYQSASMIKPFVAAAYFYKVKDRKLAYNFNRKAKLEAMIQHSSNRATNYFIDLVAGNKSPREVERVLKRNAPGVFRQTRIVERIPRSGRTYRNRASARDYSRFLYALWNDQIPYAQDLKYLMRLPNRDRIYTGVSNIPRETRVYDKTGTTARLCGDMGILVARGRNGRSYPYTFIGIIQRSSRARNYTAWVKSRGNVIRQVSNMVYADRKRVYNLI